MKNRFKMNKRFKKTIVFIVTLVVVMLFLRKIGVMDYFSLASLREHSQTLKVWIQFNYPLFVLGFIGVYTLLVAFALPITAPMTMLAGYLFGVLPGLGYSLVACVIGSVAYFLSVRYFARGITREKYGKRLENFQEQLRKYGSSYLLTLNWLMIIPFFIINTMAALANVSVWTIIWTTLVGSAPLLFVYALAGRELGTIQSMRDILKPHVIAVLLLLAVLALVPIIIKRRRSNMEV